MKILFALIALALAASANAKDIDESKNQSAAVAMVFDVAAEKGNNTIGIKGDVPLSGTARAVRNMSERWGQTPKSSIVMYGVIDIGYSYNK